MRRLERRDVGRHQPQHEIGFCDLDLGATHAFGLGAAFGGAEPGHVDEDHQPAAEIERDLAHVARRTGLVAHDREVGFGQRIEQARFAGIRWAGKGDPQALTDDATTPDALDGFGEFRGELFYRGDHGGRQFARDVALVGEVQARFNLCAGIEQRLAPECDSIRQTAGEAGHRLLPLALGLGKDQIAEAFDLGEIELAVEEGAARELAGVGEAQPGH